MVSSGLGNSVISRHYLGVFSWLDYDIALRPREWTLILTRTLALQREARQKEFDLLNQIRGSNLRKALDFFEENFGYPKTPRRVNPQYAAKNWREIR